MLMRVKLGDEWFAGNDLEEVTGAAIARARDLLRLGRPEEAQRMHTEALRRREQSGVRSSAPMPSWTRRDSGSKVYPSW